MIDGDTHIPVLTARVRLDQKDAQLVQAFTSDAGSLRGSVKIKTSPIRPYSSFRISDAIVVAPVNHGVFKDVAKTPRVQLAVTYTYSHDVVSAEIVHGKHPGPKRREFNLAELAAGELWVWLRAAREPEATNESMGGLSEASGVGPEPLPSPFGVSQGKPSISDAPESTPKRGRRRRVSESSEDDAGAGSGASPEE